MALIIWLTICREHAPSIIFMDESDSIGSARMESGTGNGDSEVQRTMLEFLNQLDGFEASNKIKVCFTFGSCVLSLLICKCDRGGNIFVIFKTFVAGSDGNEQNRHLGSSPSEAWTHRQED